MVVLGFATVVVRQYVKFIHLTIGRKLVARKDWGTLLTSLQKHDTACRNLINASRKKIILKGLEALYGPYRKYLE